VSESSGSQRSSVTTAALLPSNLVRPLPSPPFGSADGLAVLPEPLPMADRRQVNQSDVAGAVVRSRPCDRARPGNLAIEDTGQRMMVPVRGPSLVFSFRKGPLES
jgi:hypothetical protein